VRVGTGDGNSVMIELLGDDEEDGDNEVDVLVLGFELGIGADMMGASVGIMLGWKLGFQLGSAVGM